MQQCASGEPITMSSKMSYGNSTNTLVKPMSCNSASGTGQVSFWWNKRWKKWIRVIMANRSLSATS